MTTYSGNTNSKSLNARAAEADGRFPASRMAEVLRDKGLFRGVTPADIKAAVHSGEWHHVGSYAARVDYYGLDDVFQFRRELRAAIAARKAKAAPAERRFENCTARWLEWSGSRRHPRATERTAEGVAITVKGNWATLHLPPGAPHFGPIRKSLGTRGFTLRLA